MLISKAMTAAINEQVGNELAASNQYVQIACYFDEGGLPVLSRHFFAQAAEERDHALRFIKYLLDMDGAVRIPAVPAPTATFKSAEAAVRLALDSELRVTQQINAMVDLALREKDHLAKNMLEWFVAEQREEVSSMDTLLKMVRRAGEPGLFHVEQMLLKGALAEGDGGDDGAGE